MFRRRSYFRPARLDVAPSRFSLEPAAWAAGISIVLLLLGVVALAWHPLGGGDDVWAHAAIGRWIVAHRRVPGHSLFLWGAPPTPWIAHSWASQVAFYAVLQRGGPVALVMFGAAMSALPFALLWRRWTENGRAGVVAAALFALAIFVSSPRFRTRPELFSALFLTLLLLFLARWPHRSRRELWLLPPLFCAWANFHGGVALGLALLAATLLGEIAQEEWDRLRAGRRARANYERLEAAPRRWPWLLLTACGCALAVFVNPYGLHYIEALKPVSGAMFASIDEWKPFWKDPVLPPAFVSGEALLWGAALSCWILNPRRRWAGALWLLLMGVAFVMARRQLWLCALTCLCVSAQAAPYLETSRLGEAFARLFRRRRAPDLVHSFRPPRWNAWQEGALPLLTVAALGVWLARVTPSDWRTRRATQRDLPVHAATAIVRLQPRRLFNDYEFSSYLQWRCAGRPTLFIDLLNAYPDWLLANYLDMTALSPRGLRLWAHTRPDVAYVRPHEPKSSLTGVETWLRTNPDWKRAYRSVDGTLWVRKKR